MESARSVWNSTSCDHLRKFISPWPWLESSWVRATELTQTQEITSVCVGNIWIDVKLLPDVIFFSLFDFLEATCLLTSCVFVDVVSLLFRIYSRGAEGTCKALPNEALCKNPRKHGLITRVYLRQNSLNCWFLFLFNAVPCFHSHSVDSTFSTFSTLRSCSTTSMPSNLDTASTRSTR